VSESWKRPALDHIELLADVIRGRVEAVRANPAIVDEVVQQDAEAHGVQGLVRRVLKAKGLWDAIDQDVRSALDAQVHHDVLAEECRRGQTACVVRAMRSAGVSTLTIKGSALAYTHYPAPYLRPRCDTDLLVSPDAMPRASEVLESLGYSRLTMVAREVVHTQSAWVNRKALVGQTIDLHWRISARPLLAKCLSFEELLQDAVTVPRLDEPALVPAPVHALMLACVHRVAHHGTSRRLIWLYDISLLADGLSADEWERFLKLASGKAMCGVCADGIETAAALVGCSTETTDRLETLRALGRAKRETSASYVNDGRDALHRILIDVRHTRRPFDKIRLLAGHLFPDADYMRSAFGARSLPGLAYAYLHRLSRNL
jgi:Uncharacterised nucleotidyltransferase